MRASRTDHNRGAIRLLCGRQKNGQRRIMNVANVERFFDLGNVLAVLEAWRAIGPERNLLLGRGHAGKQQGERDKGGQYTDAHDVPRVSFAGKWKQQRARPSYPADVL